MIGRPHPQFVYSEDAIMDDEDLKALSAAASLAEINQPISCHSLPLEADRSNCIVDGKCPEALTEECTEACHPCEEPHSCNDDNCCDPRSVCWDPECLDEDFGDVCLPCHDHVEVPAASKNPFDVTCDFHSMLGFDWSQSTSHEEFCSSITPSTNHNEQQRQQNFQFNCHDQNCWPEMHNLHNSIDNFQFGTDQNFQSMSNMFQTNNNFACPDLTDPLMSTDAPFSFGSNSALTPQTPTKANMTSPSDMTRSSSRTSYQSTHYSMKDMTPMRSHHACHSRNFSVTSVPPSQPICLWRIDQGESEETCGFIAGSSKELHEHIIESHISAMGGRSSSKHEKEPMICRWKGCKPADEEKVWTALQHIKDHMLCHSQVREICQKCGKEVRDKKSLKAHQAICGNEDNQLGFKCDICGKVLKSPSTLKQHKNQHSGKKFTCDECGHSCSDQSNLRKHKRTHQKDQMKAWRCQCCNKPFPNAYNRNRHEDTMAKKGHQFIKSISLPMDV